jgi:branched-chain amino acid transport system substrate-binding protein
MIVVARSIVVAMLSVVFVVGMQGASSHADPASIARAAEPPVIKIGIDLPLSGAEVAGNISIEDAMLLAIEQANAANAVTGYRLAAVVLDDSVEGRHDPAQGAQNVRTFIADPAVVAFLGPANSNVAKAQIPLANDAGLAQIAPSTTADELTRGPDAAKLRTAHPDVNTFFRLCTVDSRQGAAAASFVRRLGLRRAFVIDDNETYGKGLADVFERAFTDHGDSVVGHEHILPTQTDFTPLLTKAHGSGAQVLFYGGMANTGGSLLRRQQVSNGFGKIVLVGGDGLAGADYIATAGSAADGTYYTVSAADVTRLPAAATFIAAYRKRYHDEPGAYSANGYAAATIAIAAIAKTVAASHGAFPDRAAVLRGVARTRAMSTPIGPVSFDRFGDMTTPFVSLYTVRAGQPMFISGLTIPK